MLRGVRSSISICIRIHVDTNNYLYSTCNIRKTILINFRLLHIHLFRNTPVHLSSIREQGAYANPL